MSFCGNLGGALKKCNSLEGPTALFFELDSGRVKRLFLFVVKSWKDFVPSERSYGLGSSFKLNCFDGL